VVRKGPLEQLVRLARKNAYYTKPAETDAERDRYYEFIHYGQVGARILEGDATHDDSVFVAVTEKLAVGAAKRGSPTHLKMQAMLPYPGESYECFAEILKLKQRTKRHSRKP
jgi:hypothetical protein